VPQKEFNKLRALKISPACNGSFIVLNSLPDRLYNYERTFDYFNHIYQLIWSRAVRTRDNTFTMPNDNEVIIVNKDAGTFEFIHLLTSVRTVVEYPKLLPERRYPHGLEVFD
jgi:hypothetical protein